MERIDRQLHLRDRFEYALHLGRICGWRGVQLPSEKLLTSIDRWAATAEEFALQEC